MRIVTRVDFDSVVCAVLLYEALDIKHPVKWIEPSDVQKGLAEIKEGDIVANLPYHENCSLWFDHHYSNKMDAPFNGAFKIAPSAARVIYEYYEKSFNRDFSQLVQEADKIDDARLSMDEVIHPEQYPYVLLSMTISSQHRADEPYWNKLIALLREHTIEAVMQDADVEARCARTIETNKTYKHILREHTKIQGHVAITDFRSFESMPDGNRFLAYSMYPEAVVHVRIGFEGDPNYLKIRAGHSIFNRNCNVNIGLMFAQFEGGGHRGAGAASFHISNADVYLPEILNMLMKNENNETE